MSGGVGGSLGTMKPFLDVSGNRNPISFGAMTVAMVTLKRDESHSRELNTDKSQLDKIA